MRTSLLLVILGCVSWASSARDLSRCPSNLNLLYVRTFRDKCYQFCTYEERYWNDARDTCKRLGGRMVVIPDLETQQFLVRTLNAMQYDHSAIWIGLSDADHEGDWRWDRGEKANFTNWIPNQPGLFGSLEDCAAMETQENYKWGDYHCHIWPQYYSFICQFDMLPAASTTARVPVTYMLPAASTTARVPVTFPANCGDITCTNDCGQEGYVLDQDGCPLNDCKCNGE